MRQRERGSSSRSTTAGGKRARDAAQRGEGSPERGRGSRRKAQPTSDEEARSTLAASPKLYYRIGEVSELTGVKAHVLRYWETEFRWMAPPKSRSKQRLYRKRDIEFVWLLKKLLWEQRYTIAGARQRIQELGLDEALAQSAEAECGEASRGGSLDGSMTVPLDGVTTSSASAREPVSVASCASPGDSARVDWLGLRVALEGMQGELLALRGALAQGL